MSTLNAGAEQADRSPWYRPPVVAGAVPPRSAAIGAVVALVALGGLAVGSGALVLGGAGVVVGVLLAVSIAGVGLDRAGYTIVGGVGVLVTTAAAIGLPLYGFVSDSGVAGGIALAGVFVGFGLTRFRVNAAGAGAVSVAIGWLLRVGFVLGGLAIAIGIVRIDLIAVLTRAGPAASLLVPGEESGAIVGFVVVAWLALGGIWAVLVSLPPAEILPPGERDRYQRVTSRVLSGAVAVLGFGSIALAMAAAVTRQVVGSDVLWGIVTAPGVRTLLVRLAVTAVVIAIVIRAGRSIGASLLVGQSAWVRSVVVVVLPLGVAGVIGGAPAVAALGSAGGVPSGVETTVVPLVGTATIGVVGVAAAVLALAGVLALLPVLSGVGLVPSATAGPRIACGGLLVGAIAAAIGGAGTVAIVGVVAAGVVWDVTEYGVGVAVDLGDHAGGSDSELIHAGASVAVGLVSVVSLVVFQSLLRGVEAAPDGAIVTLMLAIGVVVLVFVELRG